MGAVKGASVFCMGKDSESLCPQGALGETKAGHRPLLFPPRESAGAFSFLFLSFSLVSEISS